MPSSVTVVILVIVVVALCIEGQDIHEKWLKDCHGPFAGWRRFRAACYKYFKEDLTFEEAYKKCRENGASLSSSLNQPENDFLYHFAEKSVVWLGGNDIKDEGTWRWSDGEPYNKTHGWHMWSVAVGNEDWAVNNERVYRYFGKVETYEKAIEACQSQHAEIVLPRDEAEGKFVMGLLSEQVWVGLRWNNEPKLWEDAKNEPVTAYKNWKDGEVHDGTKPCAMMSRWMNEGKWFTETCDSKAGYVCVKDKGAAEMQPDNNGGNENCMQMKLGKWNDQPCDTKFKFICKKDDMLRKTVCKESEVKISCKGKGGVGFINVTGIKYGRGDIECDANTGKESRYLSDMEVVARNQEMDKKVKERCNGKQECSMTITKIEEFTFIYATVEYFCRDAEGMACLSKDPYVIPDSWCLTECFSGEQCDFDKCECKDVGGELASRGHLLKMSLVALIFLLAMVKLF